MRTFLRGQTTFMISHHPQTSTVAGFGIFSQRSWMEQLVGMIQKSKSYACHPMLVPTLMVSYTFEHHLEKCYAAAVEVKELERRAGVREFSDLSNEDFLANSQKVTRETADLKARLADLVSHLQPMEACFMDPIVEGVQVVEQLQASSIAIDAHSKRRLRMRGIGLEDRIRVLKQGRVNRLCHVESLIAKMETTMSAVGRTGVYRQARWLMFIAQLYHMFAQRDSRVNIQMAADSRSLAVDSKRDVALNLQAAQQSVAIASATKRDSSSMKSIAVLTTVFLPGTFVAVST